MTRCPCEHVRQRVGVASWRHGRAAGGYWSRVSYGRTDCLPLGRGMHLASVCPIGCHASCAGVRVVGRFCPRRRSRCGLQNRAPTTNGEVSTDGYGRAQPDALVPVITGTRGSERCGSPALAGFSLVVGGSRQRAPPQHVPFLIRKDAVCGYAGGCAIPTNQHVEVFVEVVIGHCRVVCRCVWGCHGASCGPSTNFRTERSTISRGRPKRSREVWMMVPLCPCGGCGGRVRMEKGALVSPLTDRRI